MFETFQLSNDAFYYLKDGEEPLVDEALDEALVVEALYPDGFTILDFKPLGNTGYIEARIGPKVAMPAVKPVIRQVSNPGYDIEAVERNRKEYADSDEVQMLSEICRLDIVHHRLDILTGQKLAAVLFYYLRQMRYHYRNRIDKRISRNIRHYLLVCAYPLCGNAECRLYRIYSVNGTYNIAVIER